MSKGLSYIKVFLDWTEATRKLKDAEKGRLIDAMIAYAKGEQEVETKLTGSEAYVFPMFQLQIDRDREELLAISEARSESGKKGGRPKKQKNQMLFSESKKSEDKDKDKDKDKDNILPSSDGEDTRTRDADHGLAKVMTEYMDRIDTNPSPTSMGELKGYVERLGPEVCLQAVYEAIDAGAQNWKYVQSILRNCEKDGIRSLADWNRRKSERERGKQGRAAGDTGRDQENHRDWGLDGVIRL